MRLCWTMAFVLLAFAPAGAQEHIGWPTNEIAELAAGLLGVESIALQPVERFPERILLDPTERASCFVQPGEQIWFFQAGEFSSGVLIGDAERIHTLWFYFPILAVSDSYQTSLLLSMAGFSSICCPDGPARRPGRATPSAAHGR